VRRQNGGHGKHAGQPRDGFFASLAQRLRGAAALRRHFQRESHVTVAHHQAFHHARRGDASAGRRIGHAAKGFQHVVSRYSHAVSLRCAIMNRPI